MKKSLFCCLLLSTVAMAQEDLLKSLDQDSLPKPSLVTATFKGTRVINGQSIENPGRGVLQFMFLHRFGAINQGGYNLFGLDVARVRLGLDYGITSRLAVGIGRSGSDKAYDGYAKYKLLRQDAQMPLSMTIYGNLCYDFRDYVALGSNDLNSRQRTIYTTQLLIARKFSQRISLQLSPTLVHRNYTDAQVENNDVVLMGGAGRFKLSKRIAFCAEYYYKLPKQTSTLYQDVVSLGFDIETGGHVFQLHFTNAQSMTDPFFLTRTTGRWQNGGIYFGFNISRAFTLGKNK
jgi:hypothetical protein